MKSPSFAEAIQLARTVDDHYSMWEEQQEVLYERAMEVAGDGVIVELGTAYGKTSVILAYTTRFTGAQFHAVDDFGLVGTAQDYRQRLTDLQLRFQLHVGRTNEVSWRLPIDFLVVDAGHDMVNIRQDTARWIPFVKLGGVAAFHDYEQGQIDRTHPHYYVKHYVDLNTKGWETLAHVKQLKVLRKPDRF